MNLRLPVYPVSLAQLQPLEVGEHGPGPHLLICGGSQLMTGALRAQCYENDYTHGHTHVHTHAPSGFCPQFTLPKLSCCDDKIGK